jgi:hypothetical protein
MMRIFAYNSMCMYFRGYLSNVPTFIYHVYVFVGICIKYKHMRSNEYDITYSD